MTTPVPPRSRPRGRRRERRDGHVPRVGRHGGRRGVIGRNCMPAALAMAGPASTIYMRAALQWRRSSGRRRGRSSPRSRRPGSRRGDGGVAAPDAAGVDRGVRRADPGAHPRADAGRGARRRQLAAFLDPRRATRRWCSSTSCTDATDERPPDDTRRARHPAVHERVDVRPQGRDAAAPLRRREPRRHRRAAAA